MRAREQIPLRSVPVGLGAKRVRIMETAAEKPSFCGVASGKMRVH
jgi:hypothetical protein